MLSTYVICQSLKLQAQVGIGHLHILGDIQRHWCKIEYSLHTSLYQGFAGFLGCIGRYSDNRQPDILLRHNSGDFTDGIDRYIIYIPANQSRIDIKQGNQLDGKQRTI